MRHGDPLRGRRTRQDPSTSKGKDQGKGEESRCVSDQVEGRSGTRAVPVWGEVRSVSDRGVDGQCKHHEAFTDDLSTCSRSVFSPLPAICPGINRSSWYLLSP